VFYSNPIAEIDVHSLAVKLAETEKSIQLIDVREKSEFAIAQIPGFELYPLSEFEQWSEMILIDLQPETETIVICHHGMRSAQMCQWLAMRGFSNVQNVMGGIDAYSRLVDNQINRY
jgi:rhodanese-related sulfurtransferase